MPNLLAESRVLDAWRLYFETAQRLITQLDTEIRADTGLSLSDYNLLLLLVEAPERSLRMSALAAGLVFSAPRLTYRVSVLEERGWVVKSPCPDDGRAQIVTLTDTGWEHFRRAGAVHRTHIEKYFAQALSAEDAEHILRISQQLGERLDAPEG